MKPLPVTIAIPVYNPQEAHFRAALQSVLGQSHREIEVIVGDDHSTSCDVEAIVNESQDSRVTYYRHERRLGMVENWNWLIRQAQGDWVNLFHQDDVMLADNVRNAVICAATFPGISFQYCDVQCIDHESHLLPWQSFVLDGVKSDTALSGDVLLKALTAADRNGICAPAVFAKREFYHKLLPFSRRPAYTTDLNMWLRMAGQPGVSFVARQDVGLQYRFHAQQETARLSTYSEECLAIELFRVMWRTDAGDKVQILRRCLGSLWRNGYSRLWQAYYA